MVVGLGVGIGGDLAAAIGAVAYPDKHELYAGVGNFFPVDIPLIPGYIDAGDALAVRKGHALAVKKIVCLGVGVWRLLLQCGQGLQLGLRDGLGGFSGKQHRCHGDQRQKNGAKHNNPGDQLPAAHRPLSPFFRCGSHGIPPFSTKFHLFLQYTIKPNACQDGKNRDAWERRFSY